jgi:hypothetical protein
MGGVLMLSLSSGTAELRALCGALAKQGRAARSDAGVPLTRQVLEMLLLRIAAGKLRPDDYYKLRVYRKQLSFEEKRKYMSNHAIPHELFRRWEIVASDKLLTYGILSSFGVVIPKTHAVCHSFREHDNCRSLKTVPELESYLRDEAPYPIVAKPVHGVFSRDVCLLERYDPRSDTVVLAEEVAARPEHLARRFLSLGAGYLLQEQIRPHVEIRERIGERICTLRVIIMLDGNEPRLILATWKINIGDNVADNYWREGNLLAELDQVTGVVLRCMTGLGPKYRLVESHPRSGKLLIGFQVPHYAAAINLVMHACRPFPGLPIQAWDIAITDDGPVPLEVNAVGSLFIPQLVNQKGLWNGDFRRFIEQYRHTG